MQKQYFVYILASKKCGTLYTGMTSRLVGRSFEHKTKAVDSFTKKYRVSILVHYEILGDPASALHREKCIKEWKREWKIKLIEQHNPHWRDLYPEICA
ncbi:MAG: GIY-YIG nuclease family protein [Alphaproteobacteria bacterium]|nr:MAG: GIY-YIG nuclease family protein [Alphaproteobacteria bacterium]